LRVPAQSVVVEHPRGAGVIMINEALDGMPT
jgi:hypothetical protein